MFTHLRLLGITGIFFTVLTSASAHVELEKYLQQRVTTTVSRTNVDITIEVLFTGSASLNERRLMDADGDGTLSSSETQEYLKAIALAAESKVVLRADGKQCAMTPLYDAELDFLDSAGIVAHPHVLRLYFFARTPESFHAGTSLTLDSMLWADAPSLIASTVRGEEGIDMLGSPNPGLQRPSPMTNSVRIMTATCRSAAIRLESSDRSTQGAL